MNELSGINNEIVSLRPTFIFVDKNVYNYLLICVLALYIFFDFVFITSYVSKYNEY